MAEERSGVALGNRWLVERRLAEAPIDEREHEIHQGDEVAVLDAPALHALETDAPELDAPALDAPVPEASTEERFGDAVLTHNQRLARFAYLLSGSAEIAEASVAETYARLWPKFRRGRIQNVLPYLMRETIVDVRDRTRRDASHTTGRSVPDDLETPWAALQHLPFDERSALVVHLVEGVSLDETATLLDEPIEAVEIRIDTGLGRIAELLTVTTGNDGDAEHDGGTRHDG